MLQQSRVYCPCGSACRGGRGRLQECQLVEESYVMPERFQHDFLERSATAFKGKSALGKWANAATAMGAAYGLVKDQNNNATSYEVFKCPACGCEALYQYRRQNGTTNWAKFADIRYCAR